MYLETIEIKRCKSLYGFGEQTLVITTFVKILNLYVFYLFAGLTMLACLSSDVSFLLLTLLWISFPVSYIAMEKQNDGISPSRKSTSYKEIPYSPVKSDCGGVPESKLFCNQMLTLVWHTLPVYMELFVSPICKQSVVNGVVTTIAFANAPVTPRNQYLLYVLASGVGDVLGRPYLGYLSWCGFAQEKCIVSKSWIPAFFNVAIVNFMVFASWFRFLPHFYVAVVLVIVTSLLTGVVYVNSFHNAGEGLSVEEERFCRTLMTGTMWAPNVAVALITMDTESRLRKHCLLLFPEVSCYIMSPTAWTPSTSCVLC